VESLGGGCRSGEDDIGEDVEEEESRKRIEEIRE
jgi:hypothetical protein